MATTNTYLTFDGNCEEAFTFYKSVFGGAFSHLVRFSDMPKNGGDPVTTTNPNKIMHISLPIGTSVLMGCDAGSEWADFLAAGNNFSIAVSAGSRAEAEKIFGALAQEGQISRPLTDTFWGAYFGMVIDQFDINWMVSFDEKQ